jgi:hypothetical protein
MTMRERAAIATLAALMARIAKDNDELERALTYLAFLEKH